MIPERQRNTVTSTVAGESVAMQIHADAVAHIMGVLTDLYADPEMAVVREYATNAADSHKEAGVTRPIEVSTPTALRPLYTVRDYGLGLDAEDIRSIYSQYGASTKRATNDAVGMLGLGCKSALAYVDQFTVTGVKGGRRIEVSVSRDAEGAGNMIVLDERDTDEPNGATITIPAKQGNELEDKAREFFAHWPTGSVLINGKAPEAAQGTPIGERFLIQPHGAEGRNGRRYGVPESERLLIVQGGVPYPAPADFRHAVLEGLPDGMRLVAHVPIGSVSFAPSREALLDHPSTRAALEGALAEFAAEAAETVTASIADADNRAMAAAAKVKFRAALGAAAVEGVTYNGEDIPDAVKYCEPMKYKVPEPGEPDRDLFWGLSRRVQEDNPDTPKLWRATTSYRSQSDRYWIGDVKLSEATSGVWVLGFDNASWTAPMRRKLDSFCQDRGIEHHGMIYLSTTDYVPMEDWLEGADVVNWAEVRKWKDPNAPTHAAGPGVKYAGTYPATYGGYRSKMPTADIALAIADGAKLFYFGTGNYDHRDDMLIEMVGGKVIVAMMPETRVAKFLRTFPSAKQGGEALREAATKWARKLTPTEREGLEINGSALRALERYANLPADQVADPALAKLLRLPNAITQAKRGTYSRITHLLPADLIVDNKNSTLASDITDTLCKYPLLEAWPSYGHADDSVIISHTLTYVNAIHNQKAST